MHTGVNPVSETILALQSSGQTLALCAALDLSADDQQAPDWVHLLPAGEIITGDGRGPYSVPNAGKMMLASLTAGDRLPIDENHSTDLAAPRGEPAPARGWITELQQRQDGIWGKVEWTLAGRRLVVGKAYRGISPVIEHLADKTIVAIRRASLVNKPNLRGLTALHQTEVDMTLLEKLAKALGLATTTSEDALVTAVTALHAQQADKATALQAQLGPIAKAAGLDDKADAAKVLTTVTALMAGGTGDQTAVITALQGELTLLGAEVKGLREGGARERATTFVDGAIAQRKVGVSPLRDHYISMHMENPARVEKEIGAMVSLNATHTGLTPPANTDGTTGLTAEDRVIIAQLQIDPVEYAKTKAALETAL